MTAEVAWNHRIPAVSVVVPTRNEAPNIAHLLGRLRAAMNGLPVEWEVIFVDDSDDNTPAVIRSVQRQDRNVRLIHRVIGDRAGGLGGAVQAGFGIAVGYVFVVMDGDLQHPPEMVPSLVRPIMAGVTDLVVGTRYQTGGNSAGLAGSGRQLVSSASRVVVHCAIGRSRPVTDPLSGLFAVNRAVLEGVVLQTDGFKILLEILVRARWRTCLNVPYQFGTRHAGRSKAAWREGARFARHLTALVGVAPPEPSSWEIAEVWIDPAAGPVSPDPVASPAVV